MAPCVAATRGVLVARGVDAVNAVSGAKPALCEEHPVIRDLTGRSIGIALARLEQSARWVAGAAALVLIVAGDTGIIDWLTPFVYATNW